MFFMGVFFICNIMMAVVIGIIIFFFCIITPVFIINHFLWNLKCKHKNTTTVAVVVLGDLGHSPRMQNHASALARMDNVHVHFIGYDESPCPSYIINNSKISIHSLPVPMTNSKREKFPKPMFFILKTLEQIYQLGRCLLSIPHLDCILMQNPPSVPAMPVIWILSRLRGSFFVIDWHNYGWSLLKLSTKNHIFVRLYQFIEKYVGRTADANFCVSKAMKDDLTLSSKWGLQSKRLTPLPDRHPPHFRPLAIEERHQLLSNYFPEQTFQPGFRQLILKKDKPYALQQHPSRKNDDCHYDQNYFNNTCFYQDDVKYYCNSDMAKVNFEIKTTLLMEHVVRTAENKPSSTVIKTCYRQNRPAVLITSTSWTPDEDFLLLWKVLCDYETLTKSCSGRKLPNLVVIITGKGPGQSDFEEKARNYSFQNIQLHTAFLPSEDYWRLLASADIGISLHSSSSGLDLPMKVVDMLGVGLPVLALNFSTLSELVKIGINGDVFNNADELLNLLCAWLEDFPSPFLKTLHKTALAGRSEDWFCTWDKIALPIFTQLQN